MEVYSPALSLKLCLSIVVCVLQTLEAIVCWQVIGSSEESKFDAPLARVSIISLPGVPQTWEPLKNCLLILCGFHLRSVYN
jgi:hypothetical protein